MLQSHSVVSIEIAMIDHNDNLGFLFLTAFPHHFRSWTIQSKVIVFFIIPLKKIQIQMKRPLHHQISARYFNSRLALQPPITK